MKTSAIRTAVAILVLVGSCLLLAEGMPEPSVSEYFLTTGGGFMSHGPTLSYSITIKPRKLVNGSKPWYARAEFQNPAEPTKVFVQLLDMPANEEEFSIHSESFESIKNHKTYTAILKAYQDPERTLLITTHEIKVRFDIPVPRCSVWVSDSV